MMKEPLETLNEIKDKLEKRLLKNWCRENANKSFVSKVFKRLETVAERLMNKFRRIKNFLYETSRKNIIYYILYETFSIINETELGENIKNGLIEGFVEGIKEGAKNSLSTYLSDRISEEVVEGVATLIPVLVNEYNVSASSNAIATKFNTAVHEKMMNYKNMDLHELKTLKKTLTKTERIINQAETRIQTNACLGMLSNVDLNSSKSIQNFFAYSSLGNKLKEIEQNDNTELFQINPIQITRNLLSGEKTILESVFETLKINMKLSDIVFDKIIMPLIFEGKYEEAADVIKTLEQVVEYENKVRNLNEKAFINWLSVHSRPDNRESLERYKEALVVFLNNYKKSTSEGLIPNLKKEINEKGIIQTVVENTKNFPTLFNRFVTAVYTKVSNVFPNVNVNDEIVASAFEEILGEVKDVVLGTTEKKPETVEKQTTPKKPKITTETETDTEKKIKEVVFSKSRKFDKHLGLRYTRFVRSLASSELFKNFLNVKEKKIKEIGPFLMANLESFLEKERGTVQGEYERETVRKFLRRKRQGAKVEILNFPEHYEVIFDPNQKPIFYYK